MAELPEETWADVYAEIPHVRKVGRYAFFGLCAFSVAVMARVAVHTFGWREEVGETASYVTALTVFLALRDMSKNWDRHLMSIAALRQASKDQPA